MDVRTKTLFTIVLVVSVIGVFVYQTQSTQLFEGQLTNPTDTSQKPSALPNLEVELEVLPPEVDNEDIRASVTIKNTGEGPVVDSFTYSISINGTEVLSNEDSFTEMAPGDAFNFIYPIPKAIYQYPDEGTVTVKVDTEERVEQTSRVDDELTIPYAPTN